MSVLNVPVSTPVREADIAHGTVYKAKTKLQFIGFYMLQPAVPASISGKFDVRSGEPTLSVRSILERDDCQHTANDVCQLKKRMATQAWEVHC